MPNKLYFTYLLEPQEESLNKKLKLPETSWKNPRERLFYHFNGIEVWIVDGEIIRDNKEIDFTDGGNYGKYPDFIPKDEIWVDSYTAPHEIPFTILHELNEYLHMLQGISYEDAHEQSCILELAFRRSDKPVMPKIKALAKQVWSQLTQGKITNKEVDKK